MDAAQPQRDPLELRQEVKGTRHPREQRETLGNGTVHIGPAVRACVFPEETIVTRKTHQQNDAAEQSHV